MTATTVPGLRPDVLKLFGMTTYGVTAAASAPFGPWTAVSGW
jgi:hypothetical protein